jgi:hypothetical protein
VSVSAHVLTQTTGPFRLGRHVLHDARSLYWDADELVAHVTAPKTVMHQSVCVPWDQGELGSCTANAALGVLMTEPFHKASWCFTEKDAVKLYSEETRLDDTEIPGHYPPDDPGSTGLWSMKALKNRGLISSYRHAFSLTTALRLLTLGPVSTGVPWFKSLFEPDPFATIHLDEASGLAGGHQVAVVGYDATTRKVRIRNSWGTSWGDGGYCWLPVDDWGRLLHLHGDVVVPVL